MLTIPPAKVYSSPNLSKNKQEPYKRAYLPENGGLGERNQDNGPTAEKDQTKRATGNRKDRGRHQNRRSPFCDGLDMI